jgi:putative hemolysin
MRSRRVQLAIVVDDADVMTGIVTLEDLVEELVGEIASENDAITQSPIIVEGPTSALVLGDVPTREVNRQFDLELGEGPSWSTIAGLCLELAGRIPKVGETFETPEGVVLEIVAASPRQVRRVRLTWKAREPE